MSDAPDLKALARRYVDLWQDQIALLAADPALAEAWVEALALMGRAATAVAAASPATSPPWGKESPDGPAWESPAAEERTAASASAPAEPDGLPADLAGRIARLEARIALLESSLAAQGRVPGRRSGGRRC